MNYENYKQFINILTDDLEKMFEHQKDFIKCKEGCSYCCEYGEYPFTETEFMYLVDGYNKLDDEIKQTIKTNIKNIKKDKDGYYTCPFLINKKCSVYNNRGIVCRTFGLITQEADGTSNGPFCGKLGLNYAEVYDKNTKELLMDVIKEKNYTNMPRIFNLSIDTIRNLDILKELDITLGEQKSLYEWLKDIGL